MTETQQATAKKYIAAYPHLATLAQRAEGDPAAAKSLGDQVGRLAVPATVTATELWEITKLGVR